MITDARVSIRRSQFVQNGTAPERWGSAWACCGGAITLVRADAELSQVEFRGNSAGGFGGAIYAIGSRLQISQSVFEANRARAGGALMFWGRPPKLNIWSTEDWLSPLRLELRRTQFLSNTAASLGGGVLFAGVVRGDAVLFRSNESGAGGAIADWMSAGLPDEYGMVLDALVAATQAGDSDSIALARPILVDNVAHGSGAALAAASATVDIGNGLIARNRVSGAAGGGAMNTGKLILSNTTIADNPAGGVVVGPGGAVRITNSILLRNAGFNCSLATQLSDSGHNLQYPGNDCGAAMSATDPGLDSQYAPALSSAARGVADPVICATDRQVGGIDLFGKSRLERGRCDIGAIEQPLPAMLGSALHLGSGTNAAHRVFLLIVWLVMLCFVIGLLGAVWRRRRRLRRVGRGKA